jgi:hypothetical protein
VTGVMLLSQLPVALNQSVSLSLKSSGPLCQDIAASPSYQKVIAQNAPPAKQPQPIPQPPPGPTMQVRTIELLLRLGLAMLPPRHLQHNLAPLALEHRSPRMPHRQSADARGPSGAQRAD